MNISNAYKLLQSLQCRRLSSCKMLFALLCIIFLAPQNTFAHKKESYDEISVTLNVPRVGSIEIPAVIYKDMAYLPVKDLFDFLKIKNTISSNLDSVSGFFINPKAPFVVDKTSSTITYEDKVFTIKPEDFIKTETNLYLKSEYFANVFGLECVFSFRNLSVTLNTKIELPAIREMQLEQMRRNISLLKGERKADTVIKRSFRAFNIGMADWGVTSSLQSNAKDNTRFNLGLGAVIAGGETTVSLSYSNNQPFNKQSQYYRWRYVNNDNNIVKQITAGKISGQTISSIYSPITGIQFTNTPTTYRRSFGSYRLSNTTEPGWTVELYVNNILINYTKADASGFFTFEVPMVYGNSVVKLRFYGPWGEEQTREQIVSIPYNFVPVSQFEYTVSAGIESDILRSKYSRANFNYGLSKRITVGSGVEYLSTVNAGKSIPFANASVRLASNLLFSAEKAINVSTKGNLNYRLPSNIQIDLNYIKYNRDQDVIKTNYSEEKRAVVTLPIRSKIFNAFSRLTVDRFRLRTSKSASDPKNTSVEYLLSSVFAGISSNFTTYALFTAAPKPIMYTSLSLNFRLPAGIKLTPQAQYDYTHKNFTLLKAEVEKNLFNKGFLNLAYEKDIVNHNYAVSLGLRYNFSFAQTSYNTRRSKNESATVLSARGSIIYDSKTNYLGASDQSYIGRGGVIISPFLDLNCNGRRDANEPKALGLNVRVNGGRIERNDKDTTTRVIGLEAFSNYLIEFDKNSFDNVAWQLRKKTISINIEPNYLQLIEVPIAVVGEVSGTVNVNDSKGVNGISRIIVDIFNTDGVRVAKTLSESDGYFSYVGLAPGSYYASIDAAQLSKLNMTAAPASLPFFIKSNIEGDVVDGLKFVLAVNTTASKK